MYQALYRKWRPRTFDDVVGQAHITETLKKQIVSGRLSHAYLFIGTRGTGKTTCAKILSRAVNCEHPVNGNPCNACPSCLGIEDGSIMDVVELDAASNNGVDNVRALRDEAIFSPAVVKKRVYIIDEVHMLSTPAFNALLKILEEPPEHLMFILATTELQKVPATILSRCQRHSFKRIDSGLIAQRLQKISHSEGFDLTPDAAALLARLSDGGMRDAISLLDQCSASEHIGTEEVLSAMGLSGNSRTSELLRLISRGETAEALALFSGLWRDGKDPAALLGELSGLLRDILMNGLAPQKGRELLSGGYDDATLREMSALFTREQLLSHLNTIQASLSGIRSGQTPRTAAELCIIRLCEPALSDNTDNILSRISILENKLNNLGSLPVSPAPTVREEKPSSPEDDAPPFDVYDVPFDEAPPFDDSDAPPMPGEPSVPGPAYEDEPYPVAPAVRTGATWSEVIAKLRGKVSIGEYNIISDNYHSDGVFSSGELTVYAKNAFAMRMLTTASLQEKIRSAASELAGGSVKLNVIEGEANKSAPAGDLDLLGKFGNVKFE